MKVNRSVFYKRKRNPSYLLLWLLSATKQTAMCNDNVEKFDI